MSMELIPFLWLIATTLFSFIGEGVICSSIIYLIWSRYFNKNKGEDPRDFQIDFLRTRVAELTEANQRLEDANNKIIVMTIERLTREIKD